MRTLGGAVVLATFGASLVTSCVRPGGGSSLRDAALQLSGRIALIGSEPAVAVTILSDSLGAVRIEGALTAELRALTGATVRVTGQWAGAGPGPGLDVASYEVLLIDGQRPSVGMLVALGGALWLAGADTLRLTSVPSALGAAVGSKVWIVGRRTDAMLEVQSFGVIRER